MDYQTFEPCNDLDGLVKCYWTLTSPAEETEQRQKIVPDGCMEMIFHSGHLYRQYLDEENSIVQPRCFVFGQLTQPLEIAPTGVTDIFSVRFHPGGFLPFTTVPIKDMENKAVPLEDIFGDVGKDLSRRILDAGTTAGKIKYIEIFLRERLANTATIDRMVKLTVDTMLLSRGQLSVDELSEQVNINRRQLERKFSSAIGLSPKQLSRIIRLQATLHMLLNKQFTSLTAVAYEGEYYDQAHFIRDFKEFTGLTPKEFYGDNLKMSALFYGAK